MKLALDIFLIITSLLLMLFILLHRGKGGGLSSLFGGGVQSSLSGSSVVERNLDRVTVVVAVLWVIAIIAVGLLVRFVVPGDPTWRRAGSVAPGRLRGAGPTSSAGPALRRRAGVSSPARRLARRGGRSWTRCRQPRRPASPPDQHHPDPSRPPRPSPLRWPRR